MPAFDLVDSTTSNLASRSRLPPMLYDREGGRRDRRASSTEKTKLQHYHQHHRFRALCAYLVPSFSIFPGCIDRLIPHHSTPSRHYAYVWTRPTENYKTFPSLSAISELPRIVRQELYSVDDDPAPRIRALLEFELYLLDPIFLCGRLVGLGVDVDAVLVKGVREGLGDWQARSSKRSREVQLGLRAS
jgi:hypothetical protein